MGAIPVDGKVDLGGRGNPQERWSAAGTSTCIAFGVAPGILCELNMKWPAVPGSTSAEMLSGVSDLTPANIAYAMEPDELGITYLQINNKGRRRLPRVSSSRYGDLHGHLRGMRRSTVSRLSPLLRYPEAIRFDMQIVPSGLPAGGAVQSSSSERGVTQARSPASHQTRPQHHQVLRLHTLTDRSSSRMPASMNRANLALLQVSLTLAAGAAAAAAPRTHCRPAALRPPPAEQSRLRSAPG